MVPFGGHPDISLERKMSGVNVRLEKKALALGRTFAGHLETRINAGEVEKNVRVVRLMSGQMSGSVPLSKKWAMSGMSG
jgi:hypothetical protein